MKKRLLSIILLIILITSLSGCIDLFPKEFTKFCEQEYKEYEQDDYLERLTFNIPEDINRNALLIKVDIYYPSKVLKSSYQQQFYHPVEDQCKFDFGYSMKLIYIGLWHIDFWYYNGDTTESPCVAQGSFNIIVKEDNDIIYFYDLANFTVPKYALYGDDVRISFVVENTATIPENIPICFWESEIRKNDVGMYIYGDEFYRTTNEGRYLEEGDIYEYHTTITNIARDYELTVNYGNKQETKVLNCVTIIPIEEEIDNTPDSFRGIENSTWFVILAVAGAIFLFFWVKTR